MQMTSSIQLIVNSYYHKIEIQLGHRNSAQHSVILIDPK